MGHPAEQQGGGLAGTRRANENERFMLAAGEHVHGLDHLRGFAGVPRPGVAARLLDHQAGGGAGADAGALGWAQRGVAAAHVAGGDAQLGAVVFNRRHGRGVLAALGRQGRQPGRSARRRWFARSVR